VLRPVPSRDDVAAWTVAERASVARLLDEATERPNTPEHPPGRRVLIVGVTAVGTLVLLPWIVVLSATLPTTASVGAWRTAWIGFDVALTVALGTSAWSVWRRRQLAIVFLPMTAALVACDAWFDVTLSWGTTEQAVAIATALLVELPLLVLLVLAVVTILRRSAIVTQQLRGLDGHVRLWRQTLVMVPPPHD